jgi:putrescine aminotransferase
MDQIPMMSPIDADTVFARIRAHFSPRTAATSRLYGRNAVEAAAIGSRVELSDGRTALDFGSYAVGLLGHRSPRVIAAVREQLDAMTISTRILGNPAPATAAAALCDYVGAESGLSRVYFGLNGADAVEAAVKLARLSTGRHRVLAVAGAYHGKSMGALALTHNPEYRAGLEELLPAVTHLYPSDTEAVERECARSDIAALIFEPIQGESGVRPLPAATLRHWCAAAKEHGAAVIADEIQTGLRRCGDRCVALAAGLPVDAVLFGKALGGGVMPVSAAVCTEALYRPLADNPSRHTATFSGSPLATAAVPAALSAIEDSAHRVKPIEKAVGDALHELATNHPDVVRAVRGTGLFWGAELGTAKLARDASVALARNGLLVSPCASDPATLRLLPGLTATDDEVAEALDIIRTVITGLG